MELSEVARSTAAIAVFAAIAITTGGHFLTRIVRGAVPATDFQVAFYRAGHAHAGALVTLGLVCVLLTEATSLTGGWASLARTGVLAAAIFMPAGFFLSAIGKGRTEANGLIVLLWIGAGFLIAGLATLGVGLVAT